MRERRLLIFHVSIYLVYPYNEAGVNDPVEAVYVSIPEGKAGESLREKRKYLRHHPREREREMNVTLRLSNLCIERRNPRTDVPL